MKRTYLVATVLFAANVPFAKDCFSATYWLQGVRSSTPSVCFVGDALISQPDRVNQIMTYLHEFENAANIKFQYLGTCPAPMQQSDGNDFYDGDIRVVIPDISISGTGPIPGQGCQAFLDENGEYNGGNDGWGSWSNAPDDLEFYRSCLYNLKLGNDPWNDTPYLNHTLHEVGHALGFTHEHIRDDANIAACTEPNYGGEVIEGKLIPYVEGKITPYDRYSVMHYKFNSCGINGNYDYTGLSAKDRVALHIMYPEKIHAAEVYGNMVIKTTDTLKLGLTWKLMGANLAYAVKKVNWQINGHTVSTTTTLSKKLKAGKHSLKVTYSDFLGRTYSWTSQIVVLTPANYKQYMGAQVAAQSSALMTLPPVEVGW